jgi:hypothetical protein
MDIQLSEPRIFRLEPRLAPDTLRQRAMDRRTSAFGSGIGGLLGRPKAEDVELVASQERVEPMWHASCRALFVYDRTRTYTIPASAADVRSVNVLGQDAEISPSGKGPGGFTLPVLEHCREEFAEEMFVDAVTGAAITDGPLLIGGPKHEVDDPASLTDNDTVVVAAEERASSVVRQLLAKMFRPLQADVVTEESLVIEALELFYRPVLAFQLHWTVKDRTGVIEFDELTGEMRSASSLRAQLSKHVTRNALFDIGADTIGLLVPGGNIAVKVARVAIDRKY